MPVGERRWREGSVGIKTVGGKRERDGERKLCTTINHLLGFEFIWNNSSGCCFETHNTQEKGEELREREEGGAGGRRKEKQRGCGERGGHYLGVGGGRGRQ